MSTPLLATKLYIPSPRPNLVPRQRLIDRLNQGLQLGHKLTLISAPAGFGKTTLVSEWVNQKAEGGGTKARPEQGRRNESVETLQPSAFSLLPSRVAWLSLDEGDSDLTRFLAYLIAALQALAPSLGERALELLESPQPPPTESILTTLLNEIAAYPEEFALALDDYHVVDAHPIDQALTFLLEHLPLQMHLVIATREDPPLPLPRLRARGQMTELRAADLRFTPEETAVFLNRVTGLELSAEEMAALDRRTEGWIAGLQLAALSMQGRADVHGFVQAFAGDNRYIVDYLVEEVLQRQPEHVRSFLLQTAILDRLSGPLCDAVRFGYAETSGTSEGTAVTGQEDSSVVLETLERGNLFVIPLDDRRQWYRYHHLFADVLRTHLMKEQPQGIPILHRRASEWYEHNGLTAEAVRHAFAAEDFERAAGLAELAWPPMDGTFQTAAWLRWVKAIPDELIRTRPVLSVAYAWALLERGQLEAAETSLRNAERWLEAAEGEHQRSPSEPSPEPGRRTCPERSRRMVVVDQEQFWSLPASIATARAYHAAALGDVPATVKYGQRALDLLPEEDYLRRGTAAALLGVAYWARGELEAAHRTLADGMANMRTAGNVLFALRGAYSLANIRLAQGRLREAIRTYEHALQLALEQGELVLRGTADLYLRLSELYLEQDNLSAAAQNAHRSEELGEPGASPHWRYRLCLAQARIKEMQGDLDGALNLLNEAERRYVPTPVPDVRPVAALKTRLWIAQGRLSEAQHWANEQGLSVDDDLSYLREFEHITLARLLIARYKRDGVERAIQEAMALLERLLQAAEAGERTGSVIEILALQALAYEAQGNIPLALVPLERALALAEPEGYVRIFVDEGLPMAELLKRQKAEGRRQKAYVQKLLAAFGEQKDLHPSSFRLQPLVEPLSQRELEVLQLLAQGLSNREIGERLFLALPTVKGHNRNIYGKLQVKRRTEAVVRARELGLL